MPIRPRSGSALHGTPQIVVIALLRRRRLEAEHLAALRVDAAHHVADGAVLPGRVHRLEDHQQRVGVLRVQAILLDGELATPSRSRSTAFFFSFTRPVHSGSIVLERDLPSGSGDQALHQIAGFFHDLQAPAGRVRSSGWRTGRSAGAREASGADARGEGEKQKARDESRAFCRRLRWKRTTGIPGPRGPSSRPSLPRASVNCADLMPEFQMRKVRTSVSTARGGGSIAATFVCLESNNVTQSVQRRVAAVLTARRAT